MKIAKGRGSSSCGPRAARSSQKSSNSYANFALYPGLIHFNSVEPARILGMVAFGWPLLVIEIKN
jgi:hypothetical protein